MRVHAAMSTMTQASRIRVENLRTRERRRNRMRLPLVPFERARAWALRRQAWLQFAAAALQGSARAGSPHPAPQGPWRRFITSGVRVDPLRMALGFLPRVGNRFQWGAIEPTDPVSATH